jgi:hypothetical protein
MDRSLYQRVGVLKRITPLQLDDETYADKLIKI